MMQLSAIVKNSGGVVGDKKLLPGIHGLRGIAAFSVVLFHLAHLAEIAPPTYLLFIKKEFGYGVHLFFIVSAFSLMHSTVPSVGKPSWGLDYIIKRFFRIAPLFYFILLFELLRKFFLGSFPDVFDIILNFTLTFGFASLSGMLGIVMASWTIGVEVIFYMLLPIMIMMIKSKNSALIFMLIAILVSIASGIKFGDFSADMTATHNLSYFSFGPNLCFFMMGIYAFFVSIEANKDSILIKYICPVMACLFVYVVMETNLSNMLNYIYVNMNIVFFGIFFAVLCVWQSINPSRWCANAFWEYLGERSYSIYLLHPIIIVHLKQFTGHLYRSTFPYLHEWAFFICGLFVLCVTLVCAELTYRCIELPFIQYGKQIIQKLNT